MNRRMLVAGVAVIGTVGATRAGGSAAGASQFQFVGYAGGSIVRALNNTITSDLTAASNINSQYEGVSDSNEAAGISVPTLLTAGAVSTSSTASPVTGGYKVASTARTAGISALGGLITATAVESTSTSTLVNGTVSSSVTTQLVGLKVAGFQLPVNIPPNYHLTIPNVASVYLNYALSSKSAPSVMTLGIGVYVSLLKPFGSNAIGAALAVNPTYAAIGPITIPPSGHVVQGKSYGTSVTAHVGTLVNVQSDPTAPAWMPAGGTGGVTKTVNIAGVDLTPLAHVGAVVDTAKGTNTNALFESETTSHIGSINLFGGAIRADAITADAHVRGTPSAPRTVSGSSGLVNVKIGGNLIAINAKPNTVIKLAGLGTITINKQVATAYSMSVVAIDIVIGKAQAGFPVGAEIQLAVATAAVY
jgi:hypothetical protein